MSVKITTNQNNVTVADADKSITIINNREPNRIDIVQPESDVIYVAALGPQGIQGIQGPQGEVGLTITDLFVYRGNDTWSTTGSLQISSSLLVSQSVTGLSGFTGSLLGTASWAHSASQAISSSYALTASYINPLNQNVILTGSILMTGSVYLTYPTTSSIYFSGSTATNVGRLTWNENDGTLDLGLKGGNVTLQIGQEEVARVVNKTGIDLLEANYQAVRISGAQGNRVKVALAKGDGDANSLDTLGLVTENILNNESGFVTTYGLVRGIDTRGNLQNETWSEGDQLYLSPTTFGGLTNIPPTAPSHSVRLGYVVQSSPNGSIFVKVDNGYEIDELHNVNINTASLSYGDLLMYDTQVWYNTKQLTGSYSLTGSLRITGSIVATSLTSSLFGTASWAYSASRATTASYILSSNVSGPNGFDSVSYASSAGSANAVADPLAQNLQIRGLLSTRIALTDLQGMLTDLYTNAGNVVEGTVGTSVVRGNLCYLDYNTSAWELVGQSNNSSTNLLAVCVEETTGYFLLDGKITLDNTFIGGTLRQGYPVYLSGSGLFTTDVTTLTTGYVRIVGHLLDTDGGGNWLLNFRPDHTWIEL